MNWRHFLVAIVPNLLIITLSLALAEVSLDITLPSLLNTIKKESNLTQKHFNQKSNFTKGNITNTQELQVEKYSIKTRFLILIIYLIFIFSIISFSLFIWCWLTAAIIDPGFIVNDLKRRKIKVYSNDIIKDYFHYHSKKEESDGDPNMKNTNYLKNRNNENNSTDNFNSNSDEYFYCDALSLIRNGQMPECLLDLPICEICKVPRPPGAVHCSSCGCCVLRRDHHCAVLGQCVGDRNIKCFFLSFIYSAIFCLLHFTAALWYLLKTPDMFLSINNIVIFIFSVYSIVGAISLLTFDISFFYDFTKNFKINTRNQNNNRSNSNTAQINFSPMFSLKMKWTKFLSTLGNNWYERLLPIHNNTTEIAWKGVYWDSDNYL